MMELTRKGDYAIRGIIYLASQQPNKISLLSEIAEAMDVPQTFLAKIFQQFRLFKQQHIKIILFKQNR